VSAERQRGVDLARACGLAGDERAAEWKAKARAAGDAIAAADREQFESDFATL
jgi:hypothetical protein